MRPRKTQKAFTLVEVVVAAVIFAIAAVGLFSVFSMTRRSSDRAERRLQAAYAGRQLLEEMHAKVDETIWVGSQLNRWDLPDIGAELICDDPGDDSGSQYDWPYGFPAGNPLSVAPFNGQAKYRCYQNPATGVRRIRLAIEWTEP